MPIVIGVKLAANAADEAAGNQCLRSGAGNDADGNADDGNADDATADDAADALKAERGAEAAAEEITRQNTERNFLQMFGDFITGAGAERTEPNITLPVKKAGAADAGTGVGVASGN